MIHDEFMIDLYDMNVVWLSCCVLVIFVEIGQKRRIMILMILNGFMELLGWIGWSRISVFNCYVLERNRLGENGGFWTKSRFKHFCEISNFGCFELSCFEIENIVFIVELEWFKLMGRIGKNGSKMRILSATWHKTKNRKIMRCQSHTTMRNGGTTVPTVQGRKMSIFHNFWVPNEYLWWVPNT